MRFLVVLLIVFLGGCGGMSFQEVLQYRDVTSCIYYQGSAGPYVSLHGITVTGGATLEDCVKYR